MDSGSNLGVTVNGGSLKCTIAVAMHNEAQGLFKVLSCFALRGINVTKLGSRPSSSALESIVTHTVHWEYVFFIDFEPRNVEVISTVLLNVREYCSLMRVLGVYKGNLKTGKVDRLYFEDGYGCQ